MAQYVLDSVAIIKSAMVQDESDPWYQFQEKERKKFSTFVTTSLSIVNAYAMAQKAPQKVKLTMAITDVLTPYWDESIGAYEIVKLDDRYHASQLGIYAADNSELHPLEDIFVTYICKQYYQGSLVCGHEAQLYKQNQLDMGYCFES